MRVYLDNAATTPLDDEVLAAMIPFMKEHFGNPSSTYAEGRATKAAIERYRKIIAEGLGAIGGEIYFTSGGTEANNTAIKCAVRDLGVKRIISSKIEHSCVKNTCLSLKEFENIQVDYVDLDEFGRAKLEHLAKLLSDTSFEGKTLVSLMHANNEIGTLNDINAIGELCKQHDAYFHTDTVQTVGHLPINVKKTHVHFLSGSAHKLHGPKGAGFLYVNKTTNIGCLIHGGGQERQMRSGTENVIGIIGLGKAFERSINNLDQHLAHIESLRNHFINELKANFSGVRFNGDYQGKYLPTVLSVGFKTDIPQSMLLFRLDLQGVSASGGSACSSGANKGSYVINTLGVPESYKTVRFSFANQTTKACIDHTIKALQSIFN